MSTSELDVNKLLLEILQRVTRVETKIDGYNGLKEKLNCTTNTAEDAKESIETHISKHSQNQFQIKGIAIAAILSFIGSLATLIITSTK